VVAAADFVVVVDVHREGFDGCDSHLLALPLSCRICRVVSGICYILACEQT
jgi:hypothetical protein